MMNYNNMYGGYQQQPMYQQPNYANNYQQQQPVAQGTKYALYSEVTSMEDAKAYILAPNQSAYLEDKNANMLYYKRINNQGRYEMDVYKKEEPKNEYVKTSDFELLKQSVDNLSNIIKKLDNRQFSGSKQQNRGNK